LALGTPDSALLAAEIPRAAAEIPRLAEEFLLRAAELPTLAGNGSLSPDQFLLFA
jgi:hypothetical protein